MSTVLGSKVNSAAAVFTQSRHTVVGNVWVKMRCEFVPESAGYGASGQRGLGTAATFP